MEAFLISYDLIQHHRNYTTLINQIKTIGPWCHCLESVWIVKSDSNAVGIRDFLIQYIDNNDKLLVMKLGNLAAWRNLIPEISNWISNNI